ncbi:MAG: hypothetical protein Aureis2KO_09440 [Aureisphaera sp.]
MNKQNNKSTQAQYQSQTEGKPNLFLGGIVVLIIALTPFLYYAYESFPSGQVWETSLFTVETTFPSMYQYAWFIAGKVVPLILLLLWFFTCKHWWHWIIIVPIAMYAFQLWAIIKQSSSVDELELYYLIPLMLVIVPSVYLIRAKLFAKIRGSDLKSFEEELGQKRSFWQQIKDLFN